MENESESVAATFARYQQSATGHMRMAIAERNMEAMHDVTRPLRVLDAGGGNGVNTEWLVQRGHAVTLFDADPDMLEHARQSAGENDGQGHQLVLGSIEQIGDILAEQEFDLVVCHHVLEYLEDPVKAIAAFHALTAPDGELSLITLNPVSEVIRAIVFGKDAELARSRLTDLDYDAKWFGEARLYELEQVLEWSASSGWRSLDFRAIRVLADYISEAEYSDVLVQQTMELENALAAREPYRRFGRYLQFSFAKG